MNTTDTEKIAEKLAKLLDKSKEGERKKFLENFDTLRRMGYDEDGAAKTMYAGIDWLDETGSFKACINRVAEYVEIFGSYLYPQNPDAAVDPMDEPDQWQQKRFELEAKALDYFMRVGDLETHARRTLNEALTGGRGVLWFGYNARKGVPQAVFDTVENLFIDPDARRPEEVNWIARKRCKPRFQFKQLIASPLIDLAALQGSGKDKDIIEYYEVYMRVGIHNYCQLSEEAGEGEEYTADDSPRKYIIAENKLVSVDTWEIPFFMMDAWPCAILDFRLQPEKMWPAATLQPVMTHLKAMNWLYSFYLNRVKKTSRVTFARVTHKGVKISNPDVETIMGADGSRDGSIVDVEVANLDDPDVRKYFQALKLDAGIDEFDRAWAVINRAFEDGSGLNDLMRSGQDANQLRTAADVDFKSKRSMSRVDDMKRQFHVFFCHVMESLSFVARFLLTPEDIGKYFGKDAGAVWGRLGTPEMKAQEDNQRMQMKQMAMQQAMMQAQRMMMAPPMPGMMPPPPPPMPDDKALEDQLGPPQIVVMEDWIHEAARNIVAGSMRTMDHDAQVSNLNMFFSALAPVVGPTPGGMEMIASAFVEFSKLNRYSTEFQAAAQKYLTTTMTMAMMPPPMPPPEDGQSDGPNPTKPREEAPQGQANAVGGQGQ